MEVEGLDSGGSGTGSLSTVSKEKLVITGPSSEVSSSRHPDESELDLGLGLSLGGGGFSGPKSKAVAWSQGRILTAQDFPTGQVVSSSSSSNSPTRVKTSGGSNSGTKRSADSISPPRSGVSQVVGWPPVRYTRMNSLINQAKSPATEVSSSAVGKIMSKSFEKVDGGGLNRKNNEAKVKEFLSNSLFVKVNMDGIPIGRKVDLNAHGCYETLARALDDMFCMPSNTVGARRNYTKEHGEITEGTASLRLLDGASEFALTYEDKDGDWMLVGDVPWEMFITSVKRLKIMRTAEANGLASGQQQRNQTERAKPIWRRT